MSLGELGDSRKDWSVFVGAIETVDGILLSRSLPAQRPRSPPGLRIAEAMELPKVRPI